MRGLINFPRGYYSSVLGRWCEQGALFCQVCQRLSNKKHFRNGLSVDHCGCRQRRTLEKWIREWIVMVDLTSHILWLLFHANFCHSYRCFYFFKLVLLHFGCKEVFLPVNLFLIKMLYCFLFVAPQPRTPSAAWYKLTTGVVQIWYMQPSVKNLQLFCNYY